MLLAAIMASGIATITISISRTVVSNARLAFGSVTYLRKSFSVSGSLITLLTSCKFIIEVSNTFRYGCAIAFSVPKASWPAAAWLKGTKKPLRGGALLEESRQKLLDRNPRLAANSHAVRTRSVRLTDGRLIRHVHGDILIGATAGIELARNRIGDDLHLGKITILRLDEKNAGASRAIDSVIGNVVGIPFLRIHVGDCGGEVGRGVVRIEASNDVPRVEVEVRQAPGLVKNLRTLQRKTGGSRNGWIVLNVI